MKNSPAERSASQLILEGIVTSTNADGSANVSPMGPVVDRTMQRLRLRPFKSSSTYQNLKRTGSGVFHVTDDVGLLSLAVTGRSNEIEVEPNGECFVLKNACRWYSFDVDELDESKDRVEICCHVTHAENVRPFLGWNRAMHAVLEAAILATRLDFLPAEEIHSELDRLSLVVDKCASEQERLALQMILDFVDSR